MIIPFWILCLTVMTLVCRTTCHIEADTCREGQLQQANTAYYDNFYGLRLAYRFERTGLGYGALSSEDMSALRVRYFGQAKYSRYASEAILDITQTLLQNYNGHRLYCIQPGNTLDPACTSALNGSAVAYMHDHINSSRATLSRHDSIGLCPAFFQQPVEEHIIFHHRNLTFFDAADWTTASTTLASKLVFADLARLASRLKSDRYDFRTIFTGRDASHWLKTKSVAGDLTMPCQPFDDSNTTECYVYGHARAQWLARQRPHTAIHNPENYALYFTAVSIGSVVGIPQAIYAYDQPNISDRGVLVRSADRSSDHEHVAWDFASIAFLNAGFCEMKAFLTVILVIVLAAFGNTEPLINHCNPQQRLQILGAIEDAQDMVSLAVGVQSGNLSQLGNFEPESSKEHYLRYDFGDTFGLDAVNLSTIYTRYFGVTSAEQDDYIRGVFQNIHTNWHLATFECAAVQTGGMCQTAAAYVNKSPTKSIVVFCPGFFEWFRRDPPTLAAMLGRTTIFEHMSQMMRTTAAAVVVHEMSHLGLAGYPGRIVDMPLYWPSSPLHSGHDLLAYGAHRAQQLAYYSPEAAAANADNYALYASALSMGARHGLPAAQPFIKDLVYGRGPWEDTLDSIKGIAPAWATTTAVASPPARSPTAPSTRRVGRVFPVETGSS